MAININPNSNLSKFKDLGVLWSYKKIIKYVDQPIPFNVHSDDL